MHRGRAPWSNVGRTGELICRLQFAGTDNLTVLTIELPLIDNPAMNTYERHRFPSEIISYAVWLYYRFNLSQRDIEHLLAERGITVSYESIRLWCIKFGAKYSRRLKRKHQGYGDTFFIDEVFVKIQGRQHYLWRAVDQDGEVVDVFLQGRRDGRAAKRFFKRLLRASGSEPPHTAFSDPSWLMRKLSPIVGIDLCGSIHPTIVAYTHLSCQYQPKQYATLRHHHTDAGYGQPTTS